MIGSASATPIHLELGDHTLVAITPPGDAESRSVGPGAAGFEPKTPAAIVNPEPAWLLLFGTGLVVGAIQIRKLLNRK